MKELSIFIDESGDAGPVSRYYIVTLVFHEQDEPVNPHINSYEQLLKDQSLDIMPFHFGPLLTGHDDYKWQDIQRRKKQLSAFTMLVQHLPITYQPFIYDKKQGLYEPQKLSEKIERDVTLFLADHLAYIQSFDHVKIYYDGGQSVVTRALHGAIEKAISKKATVYRDASPRTYRLSQVADYICGIELTLLKFQNGAATKTDTEFFGSIAPFKKNYVKKLKKKRLE